MAAKSLPNVPEKTAIRFWKKVDKSKGLGIGDCWFWASNSYGSLFYQGISVLAHRLSYFMATGDDPKDLDILHRCHNPRCVNPEHLYKGTHQQNMKDRDEAGRQVTMRGADHPIAKLQDADVLQIRDEFRRGVSKADLARQYNVSHRLIRNIVNRTAWKHI